MPHSNHLMDSLREKIVLAHETDLGDFKRRVLLYLNRFAEETKNSPQTRKEIGELRDFILCFAPALCLAGQAPGLQDFPSRQPNQSLPGQFVPAESNPPAQSQQEEIELLREEVLKTLENFTRI